MTWEYLIIQSDHSPNIILCSRIFYRNCCSNIIIIIEELKRDFQPFYKTLCLFEILIFHKKNQIKFDLGRKKLPVGGNCVNPTIVNHTRKNYIISVY